MLVTRSDYVARIRSLFRDFPVVGVLGARQVGKTTLARQLAATERGPTAHYDLEDPDDLARLAQSTGPSSTGS